MTRFTKKEILSIVVGSVCVVAGALFCAMPQTMYNFLETILCWALILYGGVSIFIYCLTPVIFEDPIRRFSALLSLILGLLIMLIRSFLVMAIACLMILIGIVKIVMATKHKNDQIAQSSADLIVGIVFLVFGVAVGILFWTQIGMRLLMIFLGVILILESVANMVLMFYKKKEKFEAK